MTEVDDMKIFVTNSDRGGGHKYGIVMALLHYSNY